MVCLCLFFFFFKQKTAYEMRISDWSSDVCSSDLLERLPVGGDRLFAAARGEERLAQAVPDVGGARERGRVDPEDLDRGIDVSGAQKPVAERVDVGFQIGRASCRERVCQYV